MGHGALNGPARRGRSRLGSWAWRSLDATCSASARPSQSLLRSRPAVVQDRLRALRSVCHPFPPRRPYHPTSSAGPSTLPGQPPPGSLYYGASVPHDESLPAWEQELGTVLATQPLLLHPGRERDGTAGGALPRRPGSRPAAARLHQARRDLAGHRVGRARRLADQHAAAAGRGGRPGPLHPQPRAGERRRPAGHAAVGLRRHAASSDQPRGRAGAAGDRRSRPAALDLRSAAQGHRPGGVDRPGGVGLRPRRLQPVVADERQGVAHLRQQARRGDRLVRRRSHRDRRVRLPGRPARTPASPPSGCATRRTTPASTTSCSMSYFNSGRGLARGLVGADG